MTRELASVGVVGAGIVGLAVAREVSSRFPGVAVHVFDKEKAVAAHQSGHNSGVIHAGIYYPPGSLKAELCRRGGSLLRDYCAERDIAVREFGKLIVATTDAELAGLDVLEQRALTNRVPGIRRVTPDEIREIEPYCAGLAGIYSPHTASVDYLAICEALATDIRASGGAVCLGAEVTGIIDGAGGVTVRHGRGEVQVDQLVVCAGLTGDALADSLGAADGMRIIPFRGEYYGLGPRVADRVRGMIYPVPDPRYPFLGVHLTRDVHDHVHVGPNAVLAGSLEGYRWAQIKPRDVWHMATWPGTWQLAKAHWRNGAREVAGSLFKRRYLREVRRYMPDLELADLHRSTAGVRAQAVDRSGGLVDDFALRRSGRVLLVRNAPSPAATSSLAIAEQIVNTMESV